jgi:hypothetical protein
MTICKICGCESNKIFNTKVLSKYDVSYFKCNRCFFIQTEEPYWIEEAYNSAITKQDIGLLSRNNYFVNLISVLINFFFEKKKTFLDYGGGYGIFVRLMRDHGFDFYRFDTYCENIFAIGFDDKQHTDYELLTSFEVFEHLVDPIQEIELMLKKSQSIFFSTEIQPNSITNVNDWWYFMPWTGQHISLYSIESLKFIANKYGLNLYTNGKTFHLLTKKKINKILFKIITKRIFFNLIILTSKSNRILLNKDYQNLLK